MLLIENDYQIPSSSSFFLCMRNKFANQKSLTNENETLISFDLCRCCEYKV